MTIHETAETGQERACYIASGGGGKRDQRGGRVDVMVCFLAFFSKLREERGKDDWWEGKRRTRGGRW